MKNILFISVFYIILGNNVIAEPLNQPKNTLVNYSISGGISYSWIKAEEIVFDDGNRISHLFWKAQMPVLNAKLSADIGSDLTFSGSLKAGLLGNGNLHDFDWLSEVPGFKNFDFDNWTDQSQSKADLDRYVRFDIALGHDFLITPQNTLNIHGGFKYTNVKWTAYGGEYIYSSDGFRDDEGEMPNEKVISYEQRMPALFLGSEWKTSHDNWSFSLLGRTGLTVSGKDIDDHWLRSLNFAGKFSSAPFFEIRSSASYSLNEKTSLYVSAEFEKHMKMKGDTLVTDRSDGEQDFTPGGAGASFQAATISAGLKVKF